VLCLLPCIARTGKLPLCNVISGNVLVEEEIRVPMPTHKALPSLPFSAPSGQPSIPGVFGEPMVGKPEPMGASYDESKVSVMPCCRQQGRL